MPLLGDFGGRAGFFLQSPPIPRISSLFICMDFFSFCPFNGGHARLQAQRLARGTAMSALSANKRQNPYKRERGVIQEI